MISTKRGILYLLGHDLPSTLKPHHVKCSATVEKLWATKIGMTEKPAHKSVDTRISSFNTGNPFGFVTKASISCNHPDRWEKYFHKIYQSKKVKLEWFALHSTDVKSIQDTVKLHEETGQASDCALFEEIMSQRQEATVSPKKKTKPETEAILNKSLVRKIREFHQQLAEEHGRSYLDDDETEILRQVIKGHPKASQKIGVGIQHFFVAEAKGLDSYCFHVERVDGSEEDFSYNACFGKTSRGSRKYTYIREPSPPPN